jgi:hypothetical protein
MTEHVQAAEYSLLCLYLREKVFKYTYNVARKYREERNGITDGHKASTVPLFI